MGMIALRKGTGRVVLVVRPLTFKIARHAGGRRRNLFEAELYRTCQPFRQEMLCPVLTCSAGGGVLVARAATPLTESEAKSFRETHSFPDWDYCPPDQPSPFEPKASDWGWLNGKLVALDYSVDVD